MLGLSCPRSEVSGRRVWTWAEERFGTADAFFKRFFVWNFCPLAFLEESGRNRTPDKLPVAEREALFAPCDQALVDMIGAIQPKRVIGIGGFARKRIDTVLEQHGIVFLWAPCCIRARRRRRRRGWAPQAERSSAGIKLYHSIRGELNQDSSRWSACGGMCGPSARPAATPRHHR